MAAGCGYPGGRNLLAMSLLTFARFSEASHAPARAKSRAVLHAKRRRVASRTRQVSSNRQDHAPCASLGISMIGCESRRDNEEGCPCGISSGQGNELKPAGSGSKRLGVKHQKLHPSVSEVA
jgi:hypothetical protein